MKVGDFPIILALLCIPACGASREQVNTAIELHAAQTQVYSDLAVFTRKLLLAGERAAPTEKKQWWRDQLVALDRNVDLYADGGAKLRRLILSMEQLDPAEQDRYLATLEDLIIAAKTGKKSGGTE